MTERSPVPIRAVFFDVGETLVDETRMWDAWADALEVPRLTLFGLLGATIAREGHHRRVLDHFGANRLDRARQRMRAVEPLVPGDLYPDVLPCLSALRARGLLLGAAGNQPSELETARADAGRADAVIDGLMELPELVDRLR